MTTTLADVISCAERAYPPQLAEKWDSVGLVCGDPSAPVTSVLLAVDATAAVVEQAISGGYDLLWVHHPLLLRGVDSVAANTPKGALLHRLIRAGCALYSSHTNADSAVPGVSDALADALGLTVTGVLSPKPAPAHDKWVVFVPDDAAESVKSALFAAGAGTQGDYQHCAYSTSGTGQFEPTVGANPAIGRIGALEHVAETRIEVLADRACRSAVLAALRAAHPYEEPAFDVIEVAATAAPTQGIGRIGQLPEAKTLREFTARVAAALPATVWGVRAAGDPSALVRTVAVCGGAGDSLIDAARSAGVDVYVTSDLRHHVVDESLRAGGPAFIDAAHYATEFPWCAQARGVLTKQFGDVLTTDISDIRTDPWTIAAKVPGSSD